MIKQVLATTGVLGAVLVVTAGPAAAAPNAHAAAATANAPGCVATLLNADGWTDHLKVTNNCNTTQRVKVVLAKHDDLPCRTFPPGHYWHYDWQYPGRFDRLEYC
jgi:hypothetical protein